MRRLCVVAVLLVAACLIPAEAPAQSTCNFEAYVYDNEGTPLRDVKVLLQYKGHMPQKYRTKTDSTGRFVHVNVWEGPYDFTFTAEGIGEVTINDFPVRQVYPPEKPPTFRIGGGRPAPEADPAAAEEAGPTPEETALELAGEVERGNAALAAGNVDEAIGIYEAIAETAPEVPQVHHNLGLSWKRKGDLEKATASFRKAGELDPGFAEPHGALSVLLATSGKRDEAIVEAEKAVELAPDNTQYLYNLAVLYKDSGRPADAEKAFLRLEEMEPDNAEIQYHLGTTLLGLGKMTEAISRLEAYVEKAPADAPNVDSAKQMIAALKK